MRHWLRRIRKVDPDRVGHAVGCKHAAVGCRKAWQPGTSRVRTSRPFRRDWDWTNVGNYGIDRWITEDSSVARADLECVGVEDRIRITPVQNRERRGRSPDSKLQASCDLATNRIAVVSFVDSAIAVRFVEEKLHGGETYVLNYFDAGQLKIKFLAEAFWIDIESNVTGVRCHVYANFPPVRDSHLCATGL